MNKENFEKAKKIESRIKHIDNVLNFLISVNNSTTFVNMIESGFTSKPKEEKMEREDLVFVIQAYENEKERLNKNFERL